MKTIFQIAKIARRIPRRIRGVQHKLSNQELSVREREAFELRLKTLRFAGMALSSTLEARRVNAPTIRCAFPKMIQRSLGLLPAVGISLHGGSQPLLAAELGDSTGLVQSLGRVYHAD